MKHKKFLLLVFLIGGVVAIACPSKSGNWDSNGVITHEDTTLCNAWRGMMEDFPFASVHLRGSLYGKGYTAAELYDDLFELHQYHWEISNLNSLSFDIQSLSTIVQHMNDMTDVSRRPSMSFEVHHSKCTTPAKRTITSPSQISGNTVHGVPPYDVDINKIVIKAKSIRTFAHHVRFVWENEVLQYRISAFATAIEEDPDYSISMDLTAVSTIGFDPGTLPGRDHGGFDDVNGGNSSGLFLLQSDGSVSITPSSTIEKASVSYSCPPALSKGVYVGGRTMDSIKWEKPEMYVVK